MTFVHVADLDLGDERLDDPPARNAEDDLLQQADLCPGIVELAGDAAVDRAVERIVGIQQVERDAPDQRLPDAQLNGAARAGRGKCGARPRPGHAPAGSASSPGR